MTEASANLFLLPTSTTYRAWFSRRSGFLLRLKNFGGYWVWNITALGCRLCILVWECCTRETIVALKLFLHKFGMEILLGVLAAISGLMAVSWLVTGPEPVQELSSVANWPLSVAIVGTPASFPLFTSFAFLEVFLSGHLYSLLGSGVWQFEHRNTLSSDWHQLLEVPSQSVDGLA